MSTIISTTVLSCTYLCSMRPSVKFTSQSSLSENMSTHDKNTSGPRKRKWGSSPPQNSMTEPPASSTYTNAFKAGVALFRDVTDTCPKPPRRAHRRISKKSVAPGTILPQEPSSSTGCKGPKKLAPITTSSVWKLDEETGTFVTVVPVDKAVNRPARPAISAPRYHRPISSAMSSVDPHDKERHTSLFSTAVGGDSGPRHEAPLPEAVERPFSVQYPTYARGLDHFSVEQALSRHARRRAAAARRWDHEIIPSLIRPYMEYIRRSKWGQSHIDHVSVECSCGGPAVFKVVTTVYMDRT